VETKVMGVVGARRKRVEGNSSCAFGQTSAAYNSAVNESGPCQGEARPEPMRPVHGVRAIQLRYHTEAGLKGEAWGYVTSRDRVFIATPSMWPLGISVILDAGQAALSNRSQTLTGKVTSIFPMADEFGFPPGIGVCVAEESDSLQERVTSGATRMECEQSRRNHATQSDE
jgi:hypothetical protein